MNGSHIIVILKIFLLFIYLRV